MTIFELLKKQMVESHRMLRFAYKGVDDAQADQKVNELAMSYRETIPHLSECCLAVKAHIAGVKHEWGSFKPTDTSLAALINEYETLRASTVDEILAQPEAEAIELATAYLINHDHYHVGQLATLRQVIDPAWDAYSIYSPEDFEP